MPARSGPAGNSCDYFGYGEGALRLYVQKSFARLPWLDAPQFLFSGITRQWAWYFLKPLSEETWQPTHT